MVLHIGNNRAIPARDIIAVLDVKAMRRSQDGLSGLEMDAAARSVVVYEAAGETRFLASPISTAALRTRKLL